MLIVDSSAVVRKVIKKNLSRERGIKVVGAASDPHAARDKIVRLKPDVVILDMEMPRMHGLTLLRQIMKYNPLPVVITSSLSSESGKAAMEALALGALDVISRPSPSSTKDMLRPLADKVRAVGRVSLRKRQQLNRKTVAVKAVSPARALKTTFNKIIVIGASTGGTEAIKTILTSMPDDSPGIVIVQHMPPKFTAFFAERLDELCGITVKEAQNGAIVENGKALIAPGDYHMLLKKNGARYFVEVKKGPLIHYQRPAVDVLFKSAADYAGANALGIILTGMGADGADGLWKMRQAGARTIAQDEESSAIYGMPREAIKRGGVEKVASLEIIAQTALNMI